MMTTNLFVIANVKQLRTDSNFRILLPFFRTSWCVGVLNSAIFKFSQSGWVWHDFWGPSEFRGWGGGVEHPKLYSARHCSYVHFGQPEDGSDMLSRNVGGNYQCLLRNNAEERGSELFRGGGPKTRK